MSSSAQVKSIDGVRSFRVELRRFEVSLRQTVDLLRQELNRALEYFESDRAVYWPAQVRRASDRLAQARIDLERCQLTIHAGERPSCYDQKKALERAKLRLRVCEDKVDVTRKWVRLVRQELQQFQGRTARLAHFCEHELPRAVALLGNVAARLERYADMTPATRHAAPAYTGQTLADAAGPSSLARPDTDRPDVPHNPAEPSEP